MYNAMYSNQINIYLDSPFCKQCHSICQQNCPSKTRKNSHEEIEETLGGAIS